MISDIARTYLRTQWVHIGRSKTDGVDCTGLIMCVFRELGCEIAEVPSYDFSDMYNQMLDTIKLYCDEVPLSEVIDGDIICFRSKMIYNHCGIYTSAGTIIHAYNHNTVKMVVESDANSWFRFATCAFRWRGV